MDPNICPCGEPAACAVLSPWGELVGYCSEHAGAAIRRARREYPELYPEAQPKADAHARWRGLATRSHGATKEAHHGAA